MMKSQQKKRIFQKLWGWICLSINCLVVSLHLTRQYTELRNVSIFLSVSPICYGAIKTQLDKLKGDTSVVTIAIEYICVYIVTFLLGFKIASYLSSVSVLIALVIVFFAEMSVFFTVTYWHVIHRFFSKTKRKSEK